MSRAIAREFRIPNDAYYTQSALADNLVETLIQEEIIHLDTSLDILEPSVGGGAFVQALQKQPDADKFICTLTGIDIDPRANGFKFCPEKEVIKFCEYSPEKAPDLIIGNPPFSQAQEHILHALSLVNYGGHVCFLLRLAMLESKKRFNFWQKYPASHIFVLSERPSFTSDGKTDSAAYAFFVWNKWPDMRNTQTKLKIISWKRK